MRIFTKKHDGDRLSGKRKGISVKGVCILMITICFAVAFGMNAVAAQPEEGFYTDDGTYVVIDESGADYSYDEGYNASGSDMYDEENMYLFEGEYNEELEEMAAIIGGENVRTRVVELVADEIERIDGGGYFVTSHIQILKVKVLEGDLKGEILEVRYDLSDAWGGGNEPDPAKVGDLLIAQFFVNDDGSISGVVTQYGRETTILWMGIIFLALLAFFGGKRGLRSIIALIVTCLGLILIMIPAMNNGFSPVWAAILASLFAVCTTLIICYGFTMKTLAAAMGALGGLLIGGIIIAIMNVSMNMTGLVDDESMYLAQAAGDGTVDLRGILFAAIVISVLGGTIDVSISIASALDELRTKAENITGAEMMKSGISIGVDIMGASLNTLILSYVGGSMHLLMLFHTYNNPFVMIINDEMIACELLRALAGGFGLLLTVPVTSLVASLLMCKGNFGKLSPECFASYVAVRKCIDKVRELIDKAKTAESEKKTERERKAQEEMPENLYAKVRSHMEQLDDEEIEG